MIININFILVLFIVAELTLNDLTELHQRAVNCCRYDSSALCRWLYRNKSVSYFSDICTSKNYTMAVYDKDPSGDPASPINLQIQGLFFLANVEDRSTTGEPRRRSQFGPCRIQIPARTLVDAAPNLYFADYYCMRGRIHYVTLVMTKPRSKADNFCRDRLLPLSLRDKTQNPFFYEDGGKFYVARSLTIELFFTEDINIKDMIRHGAEFFSSIPTIGKGSSTPGGIPKNSACSACNLLGTYPPRTVY